MIHPAPGGGRSCGFTLLELLVVLLIVGLLVALVPPLFSGAVPGAKLKAAVRDLAVTLRLARNQSITRDVETQVYLNLESPAYAIGKQVPRALPAGVELKVAPAPRQSAVETTAPRGAVLFRRQFQRNAHQPEQGQAQLRSTRRLVDRSGDHYRGRRGRCPLDAPHNRASR